MGEMANMTGCQYNQLATEEPRYRLFTGALVTVWRCGRFRGSYREFHGYSSMRGIENFTRAAPS